MSTETTQKVTAGDVVSATVKYTNEADSRRKFNIDCEVGISNGKVIGFSNGRFTKKDSTEYANGNFNAGADNAYIGFNCNGLTTEESKEAFGAVLAFMEDVKASVNQKAEE